LEKAAKLAQEKAEADNQKLAGTSTPVLTAQKRMCSPIFFFLMFQYLFLRNTSSTASFASTPSKTSDPNHWFSYRPGRKRGRSRTSSRSGDSLSRSRSRSQGRDRTQARRIGVSRSRSSRDSSVDRQPQDKQTKSSAPAS
jgi:hypothetical protein